VHSRTSDARFADQGATQLRNPGGELDIDTKTRNALLRSLRYQGERGFALMSQRWRVLQHVMVSPGTIGDIAKAALVLVQFEHKMIS
jgi:DDE superfamily endonuclease